MTDTDYSPLVTHFSYFIEELVALKNIINVHRLSYYKRATGMEILPNYDVNYLLPWQQDVKKGNHMYMCTHK